jgi:hypothetical protein
MFEVDSLNCRDLLRLLHRASWKAARPPNRWVLTAARAMAPPATADEEARNIENTDEHQIPV